MRETSESTESAEQTLHKSQGEKKMKNIALIVVGILLAFLFSDEKIIGLTAPGLIGSFLLKIPFILGIMFVIAGIQGLRGKSMFANPTFRNPANDYVETASGWFSWLWCFLWAPIYSAVKGIWPHAVVSFILGFVTFGASIFVYPFFVYGINRKSYLKKGWHEVTEAAIPATERPARLEPRLTN